MQEFIHFGCWNNGNCKGPNIKEKNGLKIQ